MVGCVLSQAKPSEFYILSCGKDHGLRPRPFPQLRMKSSSSKSFTQKRFGQSARQLQ